MENKATGRTYAAALEAHLRLCTVQIVNASAELCGTGFYVAPGLVLSAAHVVAEANGELFILDDEETTLGPLTIVWIEPYSEASNEVYPLPDMALLDLGDNAPRMHPCVKLALEPTGVEMLAEGYSRGVSAGSSRDSARLEFETIRPEPGGDLLKCKDSIISAGLSGGPLLDINSGCVVGIVKAQRSATVALGGVAVSIKVLNQLHPEIWQANKDFHRTDRRWTFAKSGIGQATDYLQSTVEFLNASLVHSSLSNSILSKQIRAEGIHQPPWVKPLATINNGHFADQSPADSVGQGDVVYRQTMPSATFMWNPTESPWSTILLQGLPGHGKTWLLRSHTTARVKSSLAALRSESGSFSGVSVPIFISCVTFANTLDSQPSKNSVVEGLIQSFMADYEGEIDREVVETVVSIAYEEELLAVALDGFDEVPSKNKDRLKAGIALITNTANQIFLSSRPGIYLDRDLHAVMKSPLHIAAIGFAPSQIRAFVDSWFDDDAKRARSLTGKLRSSPEMMKLASVPLLASFLCLLTGESDGEDLLPSSKSGLYEAVLLGMLSGRWRDNAIQRAYDYDNPPDATLRLKALAEAVFRTTVQWRSRTDRFERSAIADALESTPSYKRLARNASARWNVVQDLRGIEGTSKPADVVMWEYQFDGLLLGDGDRTNSPTVQFAHPMLGEFFAAAFISDLPNEEILEALDSHRWFDSSWREIFPIIAERMHDPTPLVCWLMREPDPWFEQAMIAARCVVAARANNALVHETTSKVLLDRFQTMFSSPSIFDQRRALNALGDFVRAGVPGAAELAKAIALNREAIGLHRFGTIIALAESGEITGIDLAKANLSNRNIAVDDRAALARALVIADCAKAADDVLTHIRAQSNSDQRVYVDALPIELEVGALLVARVLKDREISSSARIQAGRALFSLGGSELEMLRGFVFDNLASIDVRAGLVGSMLAAGDGGLINLGRTLARNPNISSEYRVALTQALLRRGQISAIDLARSELENSLSHWQDRATIAGLMCTLGDVGIAVLREQLDGGRVPFFLAIRNLIALVETDQRQEVDRAHALLMDSTEPNWVRCQLAIALVSRDYILDAATAGVVREIATEADAKHGLQPRLLTAMVASSIPDAGDAVIQFLLSTDAPHVWAGLSTNLSQTANGVDVLGRILIDFRLRFDGRLIAASALAEVSPESAGKLAQVMLTEQAPKYLKSALRIHLVNRGVVELSNDLLSDSRDFIGGYSAVYESLFSPRASLAEVRKSLERVQEVHAVINELDSVDFDDSILPVGESWLSGAKISWTSNTEKAYLVKWANDTIEQEVYKKLIWIVFPQGVDSASSTVREREQELLSIIRPLVEQIEAENLLSSVQCGDVSPPDFSILMPEFDALSRLHYLAASLAEWVNLTVQRNVRASCEFLKMNSESFFTSEAVRILGIAETMDHPWPHYGAHRFVLAYGISNGPEAAISILRDNHRLADQVREYLDASDGLRLLNAAGLGIILQPGFASMWFYAALGAVLQGRTELALQLMAVSRSRASVSQLVEGLATIAQTGEREKWPAQLVSDLKGALQGSVSE